MPPLARLRRSLVLAPVLTVALGGAVAAPASAAGCDRVVAPGGSDEAAGTADAPFATPGRLADALGPGQTGCVRGAVQGSMWIGADGATVTSEPGQRGRIAGQVVIDSEAEHVTVSDLDLDATNLHRPGTIVLGDDALLARNDITNNRTQFMCVLVGAKGHDSGARAERLRIEANRIHDCGVSDNHQHGIYLEHTLDTRIVGNEIVDNADRGIQLYPDAQNTLIAGNVIDGNGQGIIFSGSGGDTSSGTRVRNNVITWPRLRAAVESWYPDGTPKGRDNIVEGNCIFGGGRLVDTQYGGFEARGNIVEDPQYADRGRKDFRLRPGSPCAELLAAGRAGLDLPVTTETSPAEELVAPIRSERASPLRIALRAGRRTRRSRTIRVAVRVVAPLTQRSFARVELRYRGRGWRLVGIRQVSRARPFAVRLRVPRRARGVAVRATLLRPGADEVTTFRAAGRRRGR